MKKITLVSAFSFAFLICCSLVARFSEPLFDKYLIPLIIGCVLLLISGIIALVVKNNRYINIFCFCLCAVSMGFLIRAWYIIRDLENSIGTMVLISFVCVLYLWLIFAFVRIPFMKKKPKLSAVLTAICIILSIVVYIILVINTKTTFLSTLGYYMFLELSFMFAMSLEAANKDELIRNLTLSSYSVFVVAVIVVIFALMAVGDGDCSCDCGCDLCDSIDLGADIGEVRQKKNKKK